MRTELLERCRLFIENRDIIKAEFSWESAYIYPLCASLFASTNRRADAAAIRDSLNLLKQSTGFFSSFRGISKMATVVSLSLSANPEEKMDRMLSVYQDLKEHFFGSEYLVVAASAIVDMAPPSSHQSIVNRTRAIYVRMKAAHPFLTSGEDSAFAALLALSELDDVHIEEEMERCYKILKPNFFSGNAVQSLSQVLALGDTPTKIKCRRAIDLFEHLKARGYKYGTSYELSTLGTLALLDTDIETLACDIMEVDDFLKNEKGFGAFGVGAKQRLMYAAMLTTCEYVPDVRDMQTAALGGIVSLVIAQQAALCASAAACAAASASASS